MKTKQALLLEAIRKIRRMERGTLCRLRKGPSAAYYNHQSWEQGRNRVRYVPAAQVAALRDAMAQYDRFMSLVQAYAEEVIQETRRGLAQEALRRAQGRRDGAGRKLSRPPTPGGKGANGRSRAGEARRRTARRAGGRA